MPNEPRRLSTEEVVARVKAWLELPGSIEELLAAFDEADRFSKELAERTKPTPFSSLTNNPKPRLRRAFFTPSKSGLC